MSVCVSAKMWITDWCTARKYGMYGKTLDLGMSWPYFCSGISYLCKPPLVYKKEKKTDKCCGSITNLDKITITSINIYSLIYRGNITISFIFSRICNNSITFSYYSNFNNRSGTWYSLTPPSLAKVSNLDWITICSYPLPEQFSTVQSNPTCTVSMNHSAVLPAPHYAGRAGQAGSDRFQVLY